MVLARNESLMVGRLGVGGRVRWLGTNVKMQVAGRVGDGGREEGGPAKRILREDGSSYLGNGWMEVEDDAD